MDVLTSASNPRVKFWRLLQTTKGRQDEGLLWAEGPHLVEEALRSRWQMIELVAAESARLETSLTRLLKAPLTRVSDELFAKVSETQAPQGLAAVVQLPAWSPPSPIRHAILLDGVQDPGNFGSICRTCLACGIDALIASDTSADPFGGKALRSSQGAALHLPVLREDLTGRIASLKAAGLKIFATGSRGAVDYRSVGQPGAFGLLLGSEGAGVSPDLMAMCDATLSIPLANGVESLGVQVAAGILMYALAAPPSAGAGHEVGLPRTDA